MQKDDDVTEVELFHWNPARPGLPRRFPWLFPRLPRVDNFGDLLGPLIVRRVLDRAGLDPRDATEDRRLLSIGSVLHFSRPGDVVWGSGINGKVDNDSHSFDSLDIRAVRGPRTRAYLESRGLSVPEVYGDPGLLLGHLWQREELVAGAPLRPLSVVPNLNDLPRYAGAPHVLDPRSPVMQCLQVIASSELVVGSSLHGIIVAEALGIPARLVRSGAETEFKYADYYLGTGRDVPAFARDVEEAVAMGPCPLPDWDPSALLDAFPTDLWTAR
jgi:pyruvyltransferase